MKNCLTIVLLVCIATVASAADSPISKGSVSLGGQLYFKSETGEAYQDLYGDDLTTTGLYPRVGGFIADGLALSAEMELFSQSLGGESATLLGIGPRVAYYFATDRTRTQIKGSVYPYLAGLVTLGSLSFSSGGDATTVIKFGGDFGMLFMFSDAAAIDFAVRVTRDRFSNNGFAESGTNAQFGLGVTAFVL